MTILIFGAVVLGILAGVFVVPVEWAGQLDTLCTWLLSLLIFSVGIDIGANKGALKNMREKSLLLSGLTLSVIIGSGLGAIGVGYLLGVTPNTSLAISAGYGWYSLSAIILKDMAGADVGAVAFLTNVFREMLAFVLIPLLAVHVNQYTSLAPPGATSMDTTLPIISSVASEDLVIVAFLNGLILSTLVPILVPFFYGL